jgi:pimeloyl-ACP methyl ester carboxylesterase
MRMGSETPTLKRFDAGRGEHCAVLLHGLGGTHRYWTCGPVPFALPAHRTVSIDLLGFGESPKPWTRYSVERHVAALHASLAGESSLTLVGHSLGAALALAYAARYPSVVRRLVLISLPHFGGTRGAAAWFARQRGGWIYTNMWATALACVLTRRVVGRLLPRLLRDIPREVAEDLVAHTMVSSTSSLWEALYRHDLRAEAAATAQVLPVLMLHGGADLTAPLTGAQELAAARATWEMRVLGGVDHHPWLRAPQECMQYIEQWLSRLAERAPGSPVEQPDSGRAAGIGVEVRP